MSSFTVVPNNSGEWARKGKLIVREQNSVLETPNFILETNFGIPPFLTPDHLLSFFPLPIALSVQLTQFYEQLPNIEKWKKGGLREYVGLEEINKIKGKEEKETEESDGEPLKKKQKKVVEKQSRGVFLFLSCNNERTGEQLPSKSENIQLITPTGRKPLTTKLWNSILSNLQPNFALSPYPEFDSFSSKKRIQKAVAHSSDFFQKSIKTFQHPQTPSNIINNINDDNNNNNNNGEVKQNNEMIIEDEKAEEGNEWSFKGFAPLIIGHPVELERKKSVKLFTDFISTLSTESSNGMYEITGVSLHGLGKGENPADRSSLLRSALEQISTSFARLVTGLGNPLEIIKGVKDGVDLFTINFPVLITEANSALIFDLLPSSSPSVHMINLSNSKYIRDWSLLSDTCHCFTCSRKYTKAYLNHLINTHELLVSTLLNMHNIYHYIQFFQVIRKKIDEGTFREYAHWFEQYWSLPLSS